jgi:hypothetical protein
MVPYGPFHSIVFLYSTVRWSGLVCHCISDVYVYGHFLDITDKDILKLFLKPEYTRLHVFAKGHTAEGRLLPNMIRIISEEIMIKKSTEGMLETIVIL